MKNKRVIRIGTIGVDAGMCYIGDPCYVIDRPLGKKPWEHFLTDLYATNAADGIRGTHWTANARLSDETPYEFPAGVVVRTGHGDGEYPVYATLDADGSVSSVRIDFFRRGA
jgi:hypothetical protein